MLNFKVFAANEGLPTAQVRKIFQDSRGFLWLATTNGALMRYEGRRFTLYRHDPNQEHSISGNTIWDIAEDPNGDLYFATEGGLSRWNRRLEQFEELPLSHPVGEAAAAKDTRRLAFDSKGTLWIGTYNAGIQLLSPGSSRPVPHPTLPHLSVQSFCFDERGDLWIGTWSDGLFRHSPGNRPLVAYGVHADAAHRIPDNSVRDVVEDPQGRLWVATLAGLCRLSVDRTRIELDISGQRALDLLGAQIVDDIMVDSSGRLWLGTDGGGLLLHDPRADRFIPYRNNPFNPRSIATNIVRAVFQDRDGDLWTGHYPTGLSHASSTDAAFQLVRADPSAKQGLSTNLVYCFEEDARGRLWIGTDRHGLDVWDRRTGLWTNHRHDPKDPATLSADTVATLFIDSRGQVWAGTWNGGLNRVDPQSGRVRRYEYTPGRPGGIGYRHIKQVIEDTAGNIWVATDGGGINRYRPETDDFESHRHSVTDRASLNSDVVLCLAVSRSGAMLAGTQRGLARYSTAEGKWHPLVVLNEPGHPLNRFAVNDVIEGRQGELWVATADAGLYRINAANTECRRFGSDSGLPSDSLRAIAEDEDGQIWGSSINGLYRLDPESGRCWTYHTDNGLQGPLFNRHARLRTRAGELLFGGIEGFNIITPSLALRSTGKPHIIITRLEAFNKEVVPGAPGSPLSRSIVESDAIDIPHRFNIFSLEFSSLRFQDSWRMRFEYRLEGQDPDWRLAGAEQRAIYTNLNPGNYVFHVRSQAPDGTWDPREATLRVRVVPAWHQTIWFKLLGSAVLLGAIYGATRFLVQRRMQDRLRQAEHERQIALERQKAAEQKADLEQQLAQAQRMDSIGRLAGGVAHDLNNMMQPILGFSELALADLPAEDPVRENIFEIKRAAERSRDLVRQLLAFARRQTLAMRTLELNGVIRGIHAMLRRTVREDVAIELKLTEGLPRLRGDVVQLEQILLNLAVNAQDAMPGGGRIFIETGVCQLDQDFIGGDEDFKPGRYLQLVVSDTGMGIPKDVLPRVLEPFFSTKGPGKGTGLGLATVYGIVRQHGGHLKIYSEEGKGTTVRVYFPELSQDAPHDGSAANGNAAGHHAVPASQVGVAHSLGHETILVVEDEDQVRALTCTALKRAGFTVLQAHCAKAALELAAAHPGRIHLLLSDIILPDFNGRELYERLHGRRPDLAVLFMSGYSADVISHHGVLHEDLRLIQKPFNIPVLLERLRATLDGIEE